MADLQKLNDAFERFEAAMRQFEGAATKNHDAERLAQSLAGEAEALRGDRVRIAQELEVVRTKARELVATNKTAVGKIDAAMSRIRAVLHSNSGG
jgi:Domain of unknown function (DUF4164)